MIGVHLIIDAIFKEEINGKMVEEILTELPGKIGMNILKGPVVVEGVPENPGWTGFVIIDKSHIAIHTFDPVECEGMCKVSIDVFSCKHFDKEKVTEYFKEKFDFEYYKDHYIVREATLV